MAKVHLHSPLPPEECVDRLRAGLFNTTSGLEGRVERGWVRLHRPITHHNSFRPVLTAALSAEGTGTRVSGNVGFHPAVKVGMAVWFAIIGAICTFAVLKVAPWPALVLPPAMPVAVAAVLPIIRRFSRGQDRLLIQFVTTTLESRPPIRVRV